MEPAIAAGIEAVASVAKIAAEVLDKKNAPDVKAAKKAQNEARAVDAETAAVAEKNVAEVRRNLA